MDASLGIAVLRQGNTIYAGTDCQVSFMFTEDGQDGVVLRNRAPGSPPQPAESIVAYGKIDFSSTKQIKSKIPLIMTQLRVKDLLADTPRFETMTKTIEKQMETLNTLLNTLHAVIKAGRKDSRIWDALSSKGKKDIPVSRAVHYNNQLFMVSLNLAITMLTITIVNIELTLWGTDPETSVEKQWLGARIRDLDILNKHAYATAAYYDTHS
jgi:hypothetical protein